MLESCPPEHMNEFKNLQAHCLKNEVDFDENILKEKNNSEDPKKHYFKNYFSSWAKGMGDAYCLLICSEKSCKGKEVRLGNLKKEVLKYKTKLEEKEAGKNGVSFEKAWEQYLFKLGPSFWKGVTDAVSYHFLNDLNKIPDEFLSNLKEI